MNIQTNCKCSELQIVEAAQKLSHILFVIKESKIEIEKTQLITAYEAIEKIESLFLEAQDLFEGIPSDVQQAIFSQHSANANVGYCLRWGLQAIKEILEDWEMVALEVSHKREER